MSQKVFLELHSTFLMRLTMHRFCLLALAPVMLSMSAYAQSEWTQSKHVDFSIRCSKSPHTTAIGTLSATYIDQIYLRFADGELTRLRYSTPIEAPHVWENSEEAVRYIDQREGGKSIIDAKLSYRHHNGENQTRVQLSLDATAVQSEWLSLVPDMITLGKWEINRRDLEVTLHETTSTITDGKLLNASADVWRSCRLMTASGAPISR